MKPLLVINDLHIPFQREDILTLITKCKDELGTIIFGGDLIDCKAISTYPDLNDITIEHEIIQSIKFINNVRKIVGNDVKIKCIRGNHEQRWSTYIAKMRDDSLYKFINPNVLEMLRDGMTLYCNEQKTYFKGDPNLEIIDDWYTNEKGVLICHPTNYYNQPTKNATTAIQYFMAHDEKFEVLICAHSHHQSQCFFGGKWAIESGCCCKPMEYFKGKTTAREQDYGFVYIVFDENNKPSINDSIVYKLK